MLTKTPFVVASDPHLEAQDVPTLFWAAATNILRHGGTETVMLGGAFVFADDSAQLMIDALPGFMHVPSGQPAAAVLRDTLAMLDRELEHAGMGSTLMVRRLADVLLIQALRAYVADMVPALADAGGQRRHALTIEFRRRHCISARVCVGKHIWERL
jgi:hypothetical protein